MTRRPPPVRPGGYRASGAARALPDAGGGIIPSADVNLSGGDKPGLESPFPWPQITFVGAETILFVPACPGSRG
jgi:hypothetical protein